MPRALHWLTHFNHFIVIPSETLSYKEPDFAATLTDYRIHESMVQHSLLDSWLWWSVWAASTASSALPTDSFFPFGRPALCSPLSELIAHNLCMNRNVLIIAFLDSSNLFTCTCHKLITFSVLCFSPLFFLQNVCFIFPQFLYQFFCGFSQQVSNLYWHGVVYIAITYPHIVMH